VAESGLSEGQQCLIAMGGEVCWFHSRWHVGRSCACSFWWLYFFNMQLEPDSKGVVFAYQLESTSVVLFF
jgi:hypothetical protein